MPNLTDSNSSQTITFTFGSLRVLLITFVAALGLVACGGSSSGGGSNAGPGGDGSGGGDPGIGVNDGPIEGTNIPQVTGLSGDAGDQSMLFYTRKGSEGSRYDLMAVDPADDPLDPKVVMANTFRLDSKYNAYAIPKADINADRVENYHIDRVMFTKLSGTNSGIVELYTVSTNPAANWPPTAHKIPLHASCNSLSGTNFTTPLQFDLNDPANSVFAYAGGSSSEDQCQVSADATNSNPVILGNKFSPIAPVWDKDNQKPAGWLMLKNDVNYEIHQFDLAGNNLGKVTDENNNPISGNKFWLQGIHALGPVLDDGSQLIISVNMEYSNDAGMDLLVSTLVRQFKPASDSSKAGTLIPFLNQSGTAMELASNEHPLARELAQVDGSIYFFTKDKGGNRFLAKVNKDGWARLKDVDDRHQALAANKYVVWYAYHNDPAGGRGKLHSYDTVNNTIANLDQALIDPPANMFEVAWTSRIYDPLYTNADGTVFYNRERSIEVEKGTIHGIPISDTETWSEAVARNADGSEPVVIKNARWMWASTNGKGPVQGLGSLMHVEKEENGYTKNLELGEVFLLKDEGEENKTVLAAVSASDPAAGIVTLGEFPVDWDKIRKVGPSEHDELGELGAGPHRLLRVRYNAGDQAVFYVNTQQENSLKQVSASADIEASPVRGF